MIFKRFHKRSNQEEKIETVPAEKEQAEAEAKNLEERLAAGIKKKRRRERIRCGIVSVLLALVSIGGLKSLFMQQETHYLDATNEHAFVEEYLNYYFQYPQDDQSSAYLQEYALDSSWKADYEMGKVERAEVVDTEVYHVDPKDDGSNIYYIKTTLQLTPTDQKAQEQELYVRMTVARKNNGYLVTTPVSMNYTAIAEGMAKEDKESYQKEHAAQGSDCSDQEKQELQTTIQLFLTTYVSDYEQAKLLMKDTSALDPLDSNTTMSVENYSSIRKTKDEYIVDADILIDSGLLQQRQNYRFRISQDSNKIIEMEEY